MQPVDELPEDYYLANFQQIVRHCQQLYPDILPCHITAQLAQFTQLPRAAQQLFVRLICRKGPLFRADKLNYPEINQLTQAAAQLEQAGLLSRQPALSARQYYSLLTVPELRRLKPGLKGQRATILAALLAEDSDSPTTDYPWPIWRLNHPDLITQLQLLYFGNLHQDLSQFVLRDLGRSRYEPYPLSIEHRLFSSWTQLENLLALEQWLTRISDGGALPDDHQWQQLLAPVPLLDGHHRRLYRLSYLLERAGQTDAALAGYHHSNQPPARERQVRVLAVDDPDAALTLCQQMAESPLDITEQLFCQQFIPKLQRRLGGPPVSRQRAHWPSERITLTDNGQRVELQTLAYFRAQGWQGYWCENDLLCGLFGLLCWQQIFADLPGAFNQPFQTGPLDLDSSHFFQRRQALFDARFDALTRLDLNHEIEQCWQHKAQLANPFVRWNALTLPMLLQAVQLIPRRQLIALLRTLAFDNRHFRSGLPDLFLWRNNEWKLVEVKGPGDQLQASQKRWLTRFQALEIPVEICHVSFSKL